MIPLKAQSAQTEMDPDRLLGGFLNIDKPAGWTSHDVVAKIRRALKIKRVGHLGTLDPQATGVLPVCFGKGTKLAALLSNDDKEYEAVLRLGLETETEDATGKHLRTSPLPEGLQGEDGRFRLEAALSSFVGPYLQRPPMYSAIKVKGVPLYKKARAGEVVERPARKVFIREITLLGMQEGDVAFRVNCSKGTYIRTLCADVGRQLGVGGHLLSLRRTRSGGFFLPDAVTMDAFLSRVREGTWTALVYPIQEVLSNLPALSVRSDSVLRLTQGVQIGMEGLLSWEAFQEGEPLRLLAPEGGLLAIGLALSDSAASNGALKGAARRLSAGGYRIKTVLRDAYSAI